MKPLTDDERATVEANRWLAYRFAKIAHRRYSNISMDDLIAAAFMGLCRAVKMYDPARARLSTRAWYYMRQETQVCLREAQLIRTPTYTYCLRQGKAATFTPHAQQIRAMSHHDIRDNDVAAAESPEMDEETEHRINQIHRAMELLDPRQREVLTRLVIGGETLKSVGCDLGRTKERTRQIKLEAIKELQRLMRMSS